MRFDWSTRTHSFQNQDNTTGGVSRALLHVAKFSCVVAIPPQPKGGHTIPSDAVVAANSPPSPVAQPPPHHSPLNQQATQHILRRKRGVRDLRAAFRGLSSLSTGRGSNSDVSSADTDRSTLSTEPASVQTLSYSSQSASSSALLCGQAANTSAVAAYDAQCPITLNAEAQHDQSVTLMSSSRLHRKSALDNLRGAFNHHDLLARQSARSTTPFTGASTASASPISSQSQTESAGKETIPHIEAAPTKLSLIQADCQHESFYIPLPLPPRIRPDEVVVDIPYVPRSLKRASPVHAQRASMSTRSRDSGEQKIPHLWRGRSTRHH